MKVAWDRLIRFIGTDGKAYYGEPILPDVRDFEKHVRDGSLSAKVISGDIFAESAVVTSTIVRVEKLLTPLDSNDVPIMRCVGLNYTAHSLYIF